MLIVDITYYNHIIVINCDCLMQLVYSLITSLLVVLLVRPEVLDRFQCADDVAPTKPPVDFNTTAVKHHVKVLSLRSLDKGLPVCLLQLCLY